MDHGQRRLTPSRKNLQSKVNFKAKMYQIKNVSLNLLVQLLFAKKRLRRYLKTSTEGAQITSSLRLFHVHASIHLLAKLQHDS